MHAITRPSKATNEEIFLSEVFNKFQSLHSGEQHFYLGEINKLLDGTHTTIAIDLPKFEKNHRFRGRPKGSKRKHISTTSTKRDPSGFEYTEIEKKGRPKKVVKLDEPKVFNCFLVCIFAFLLICT